MSARKDVSLGSLVGQELYAKKANEEMTCTHLQQQWAGAAAGHNLDYLPADNWLDKEETDGGGLRSSGSCRAQGTREEEEENRR